MSSYKRSTTMRDRLRAKFKAQGTACHICGRAIDYNLKWPDPMCFVVDHVVPLAKGGTDTLANAAAAHASCNSTKRARLVAPIIRRSGALN